MVNSGSGSGSAQNRIVFAFLVELDGEPADFGVAQSFDAAAERFGEHLGA
jgi:hypothetical protein